MPRNVLIPLIVTALVVAIVVTLALPHLLQSGPELTTATVIDDGTTIPPLDLIDQNGEPFAFGESSGRYQLVFFGYASCPDVCPLTLARLKQALESMGAEAEEVQVVFVSVDPERDSLERLAAHVAAFGPEFIGVTGSEEGVQAAADLFGVYFEKVESESASGYLVNHSSHVTVVDPTGTIRAIFPFESTPEGIAADMRYFVN